MAQGVAWFILCIYYALVSSEIQKVCVNMCMDEGPDIECYLYLALLSYNYIHYWLCHQYSYSVLMLFLFPFVGS